MECTHRDAAATGARAAAATAPQNRIFVCTGQHLQASNANMSSPCLACAAAHSRIQTRNCSVLLAHAAAVSIFRGKYQRAGAVIGFTADSGWCDPDALFVADGSCRIQTNCCRSEPWSTNASDVAAAERALLFSFAIFMDPLIFGDWPEEVRRRAGCCAATAAIFVLPKPLCYHCPSS